MKAKIILFCVFVLNYNLVKSETIDETTKVNTTNDELSNELQKQQCHSNRSYPWIPVGFEYPSPQVLQLHIEIDQFYEYMQPTSIERALRMKVKTRSEAVVQQLWPDAHVEVFGSYTTGLALPNSDIDLIVIGASGQSPLQLLAAEISASGIAEANSLNVRENFRIPLIEFIDRESQINVDMSFYDEATQKVAPLINGFQREYPMLLKLLFVLKQYVKGCDLNDVFKGGISSYAITLMCICFLQKRVIYKSDDEVNLGELLLDFFELYGRKFDYEKFGITVQNGGAYLNRDVMPCDGDRQLFCIEDLVNPGLNACSMTYRGPDIKQAFNDAYTTLSAAISSSQQDASNDCANNSILGHIVHVSDDLITFRMWVRDTFANILA